MHAGLHQHTPFFERVARALLGLALMGGVVWSLMQHGGLHGLIG